MKVTNDMNYVLGYRGCANSYKMAALEEVNHTELVIRSERKASYKRREKEKLLNKANVLCEHLELLQESTGARIEGLKSMKDSPRFYDEVDDIRTTMASMTKIKEEIEMLHKVVRLLG